MSGVTFVSDYILRDTLYPSHKEIAIQVSGAQVDRENSLEEGDGHEYDEDRPTEREMFDHYLQSAIIHGVAQTQGPHFYIHRRFAACCTIRFQFLSILSKKVQDCPIEHPLHKFNVVGLMKMSRI